MSVDIKFAVMPSAKKMADEKGLSVGPAMLSVSMGDPLYDSYRGENNSCGMVVSLGPIEMPIEEFLSVATHVASGGTNGWVNGPPPCLVKAIHKMNARMAELLIEMTARAQK